MSGETENKEDENGIKDRKVWRDRVQWGLKEGEDKGEEGIGDRI